MFLVIEEHNRSEHKALIERMFKLREEVFFEKLGWDVQVSGDGEIDGYDEATPAYLIWCSEDKTVLYGSVRLMPTTGPTLLYDVFRNTFPNNVSLTSPGIWEGTRLCIDEEMIMQDMPDIDPKRAFCLILLALCEVALIHGIHTLVSNYEPPTKRLYNMAGADLVELGRVDGFGKRPVCAGSFEVSQRVLIKMRQRLGVSKALVSKTGRYCASAPNAKAA